ncbi:MAG: PIN domain-containing protein [Chloroflexi bacterium]|nr:PIN domain-containing protein [Chloroflexota bacterium]
MARVIVVDASVMIAALDEHDALYRAAVAALARHIGDTLVVPASAFAEFMVGAHRSGRAEVTRRRLHELDATIQPITEEMADAAARLRARHTSLRLADALVLGTAEVLEAERILTGDRSWTAWSDRVELIEG